MGVISDDEEKYAYQDTPESRRGVQAGVSDMQKWASEFRVEQRFARISREKRSVGKAACPAVIHGQDIDLVIIFSLRRA